MVAPVPTNPNLEEGAISEFVSAPDLNGKVIFYNGTCGQCALEVAKARIRGEKATQADMIAITHEMQQHGEAGPTGASTVAALADEAKRLGLTIIHQTNYQEPLTEDWHKEILDNAGVNPIILEFAHAGVLTDLVSGIGDERAVQYHYIVILDKEALGYIANDGDNAEAKQGKFVVYNYGNLINATPCGILILKADDTAKGHPMDTTPTGWKDDGKTLTAPNGKTVVLGFRDYVRGRAWDPANEPLEEEAGSRQTFSFFYLTWDAKNGVQQHSAGEQMLADRAALDAANKQVADLKAQLAEAEKKGTVPPEVKVALSSALNLLNPAVQSAQAIQAALTKLG